jgi:hypothetical protein
MLSSPCVPDESSCSRHAAMLLLRNSLRLTDTGRFLSR